MLALQAFSSLWFRSYSNCVGMFVFLAFLSNLNWFFKIYTRCICGVKELNSFFILEYGAAIVPMQRMDYCLEWVKWEMIRISWWLLMPSSLLLLLQLHSTWNIFSENGIARHLNTRKSKLTARVAFIQQFPWNSGHTSIPSVFKS